MHFAVHCGGPTAILARGPLPVTYREGKKGNHTKRGNHLLGVGS